MDANNIESRLISILHRRAHFDFEAGIDDRDEELLGQKIGMPPRELVLTLYDIERDFGIEIPQRAVIDGSFNTFNHILRIIKESFADKYNEKGGSNDAGKENAL